jgi:DNA mismatch repair protein MutL
MFLEGSMRIRQLPVSVVTKIAAGEVIERPASVVKELLENSVDAGSRRIDIDIEQGGAELIQVVDDGHGILPEDLPLAFASHATSKLTDADDLFRIRTMGFRGEALASIGGVARVRLQSRTAEHTAGAEIANEGGVLSEVRTWNGTPGTRIEVRNLFFNTPVRRKFLRSPVTEMSHIAETCTRLALAQPDLHLTLRHHGKVVHEVPATAGLEDRIGLFFGPEVSGQLYPVENQHGPVRLYGFIGDPSCERSNARLQYLFVNRRWVRDRSLGHALQEAYRGLLMTGRYAVAFLFLDIPAEMVDVNVHPTKSEVRFRDGQGLYSFLHATVRNGLSARNLTAKLHATSTLADPQTRAAGGTIGWLEPRSTPSSPSLWDNGGLPKVTHGQPADAMVSFPPTSATPAGATAGTAAAENGHAIASGSAAPAALPSPPFKAIQLYDSYLVLETPEGMLVVDQHALHERVLFEQLKGRIRAGSLETQRLLIPEPIELTQEQAARVLEQRAALGELGLGVEDFGGGTVLLTSYPALLGRRPPAEIFRAVVDFLCAKDRLPTREQLFHELLSVMACHSAVRAGDPLSPEMIAQLIAQRDLADDTHHCPHGRPTALLFSRHDLDRQFRRI